MFNRWLLYFFWIFFGLCFRLLDGSKTNRRPKNRRSQRELFPYYTKFMTLFYSHSDPNVWVDGMENSN